MAWAKKSDPEHIFLNLGKSEGGEESPVAHSVAATVDPLSPERLNCPYGRSDRQSQKNLSEEDLSGQTGQVWGCSHLGAKMGPEAAGDGHEGQMERGEELGQSGLSQA